MTVKDIAWLAGLLEGEGCFKLLHSPTIALRMTDKDVIERAGELLGAIAVKTYQPALPRKRVYEASVYGAKAIAWLMTLLPLLGHRRKAKAIEIIKHWRTGKYRMRGLPTVCHPESKHHAHGLCKPCHDKERWHKAKSKSESPRFKKSSSMAA